MTPVYSWCGTPIQFHITDENAEAYNRVALALQEGAITLVPGPHPRQWWIWMDAHREDMKVYNKVAEIVNATIELSGGSLAYSDQDLVEVRLVRVMDWAQQ